MSSSLRALGVRLASTMIRPRTASQKFSTSSSMKAPANASEGLVKPPLAVFGTEGRYATALYSAAMKSDKLEQVDKDMQKLQATIKDDSKLRDFFSNPTISRPQKRKTLEDMASKWGMDKLSVNFLLALAENGRLAKALGVIKSFETVVAAHRGEVISEVTTARPLDQGMLREIEQALHKFIEPGQKLVLNTKVDPSIIGGMIVSVGDKYVDMSTSNKIRMYEKIIMETQ